MILTKDSNRRYSVWDQCISFATPIQNSIAIRFRLKGFSGNFIKLNLSTKELEWKQKLNINRPFYIQESIAYAIDDTNQILSIDLLI